jgi:acyl dehydratase
MAEILVQRGRFFEEFAVGDSVTTVGRTITEADVVGFAALSGDWNQIHTDAEYAKGTLFGQRVVHGLFGLSVATALAVRTGFIEGTVIAFREIGEWKFSKPIFIGDTIHVRATATETKAIPRLGGGSVTFNVEVINQRDQVVQHGTWTMLVKARG